MKVLGVIVNIFLPGVGTLIVGKIGAGIIQIILYILGLIFIFTGVGSIIGLPVCFIVWIWSIISAATAKDQPVQVIVVKEKS
ncbi:MAG: hypothetical protein QOI12_2905 [Alphaproteobacteria bacterium]|jgi:TM2 domain-containing membrane protein YozV|nr:hypothetical protein [Alphaproteobacteria bacterium]